MSDRMRLIARWVFPTNAEPIEHGLLEIADGRIQAIAPLRGAPPVNAFDLGNTAIIPGLINAHAHLEFSSLREPLQPAQPFTQWIRQVLTHRRERQTAQVDLIRAGLRESSQHGVCAVADIVTGDWRPEYVTYPEWVSEFANNSNVMRFEIMDDWPGSSGPREVAFRELIGLLPEQADAQLEVARQHIADCRAAYRRQVVVMYAILYPGLSPHAPYSVGPELFHRTVELARREHVPLAMHLAETKAELQLLRDGTGEFAEMLSAFGLWREGLIPRGTRIMDYLRPLSEAPRSLVVHGNYLTDDEIAFVAQHETLSVACCPRTHHFFGHDPHPWRRLMEAGANVCLGTDGRSSNPDYSLWREVQFLDRLTNGSMRPTLLKMATQNGAKALGLEDWNALAVTKAAEFTLIQLPDRDSSSGWDVLFDGQPLITA